MCDDKMTSGLKKMELRGFFSLILKKKYSKKGGRKNEKNIWSICVSAFDRNRVRSIADECWRRIGKGQ
jgi:hypothetical protein